jgi:hypothetical protein
MLGGRCTRFSYNYTYVSNHVPVVHILVLPGFPLGEFFVFEVIPNSTGDILWNEISMT